MPEPKLIILSAPSGTGKTTLCQKLLRDFPALKPSISSTTRPRRSQEAHGKDYFFVSTPEFLEGIQSHQFAEWAEVHGFHYGTSKAFIQDAFQKGHSLLLDIDVQGAMQLRKAYPQQTALIFIEPPSLAALQKRLESRATDSPEVIQVRISNAAQELKSAPLFDHRIVNDDLDDAYRQLHQLVEPLILRTGGLRG